MARIIVWGKQQEISRYICYILYLIDTLSMLFCIYIQLPLLPDRRALFKVSKSDKDKKGGGKYKGRKRGHIYLKVECFYN